MVTEKFTPQPTGVPLGAIYLPDLLWRYLRAVGSDSRFKPRLTASEIRQYAVRALIHVAQTYGEDDLNEEDLATRILLGDPHDHVCLLPDTEEARDYKSKCDDPTIILNGRTNVTATVRRAFINLISGERKPDDLQIRIKDKIILENAPGRRRRQPIKIKDGLPGSDGFQSLEALTNKAAEQVTLEVRSVLHEVFARMSPQEVKVIELFFCERYTATEISGMMPISTPTVRRIILDFRRDFKRVWNEVYRSG